MSRTDLINDYLSNRLSLEEVESFELSLLDDKALHQEVETQMALKRSLISVSTDSETSIPPELLLAHPPLVYVETMRGKPTPVNIKSESTLMAIDVGPDGIDEFTVELKSAASIILSEVCHADDEGYLNILIPKLSPGAYDCSVQSSHLSKDLVVYVKK